MCLLDFHCDFSDNLAVRHQRIFQTLLEKVEKLPAAHPCNWILREGTDNEHFNLFTSISIYQRGMKKLKYSLFLHKNVTKGGIWEGEPGTNARSEARAPRGCFVQHQGPARLPPSGCFSCVKITPIRLGAPNSCLFQQLNNCDSLKKKREGKKKKLSTNCKQLKYLSLWCFQTLCKQRYVFFPL